MSVSEIIDLSRELYDGMAVFSGMPPVRVTVHVTHEEWEGIQSAESTPAVNRLELGEHSGTHVDALSHMSRANKGQTIDTLPLSMFYTEGICLDLSQKGPGELIEVADLQAALRIAGQEIKPGDTVLLYTDHYRRAFGTPEWERGPGLSQEAARAGRAGHRCLRRGDGGAGRAQGIQQSGAPGVRRAGFHALREFNQPALAAGQGALSLHRLPAENQGRHRLSRAGSGGI